MSFFWEERWAACLVFVNVSSVPLWAHVSRLSSEWCDQMDSELTRAVSDRYGRKNILLATMVGNILSAVVWLRSTSFVCLPALGGLSKLMFQASFLLSRLIGGLSEGNVQLSTAIIGDVTTDENRSRSLALIGIAFSVCFTLGYVICPSRFAQVANLQTLTRSLLRLPPTSGAHFIPRQAQCLLRPSSYYIVTLTRRNCVSIYLITRDQGLEEIQ